ncbi:MAG: ClbS/DfsB family four-helix bundle protein [Anaerolineales bacterium]|nr:ClbS/DfsB family four-helix bundle protein [Anaerolineales bacterium]
MSNTYKERALKYLEIEWATYIERFNRWPAEERLKRVKAQGYGQFRDMLAHVLAWWQEGMEIIHAIAEGREYERKKYNFDVFNAEAVAKYKNWDEAEFLAHFEKTRQKAAADLRSMNEAAWENRRVRVWVNGVFIHHAREHLVASSRFLILDMLQNEWKPYIEDFEKIGDKEAFLKKQGVGNFREMLGHVIGWWDEGEHIITGILKDPNFKWQDRDTDAVNAELIVKYKKLSDAETQKQFESKRQAMIKLVNELPEEAFTNRDIEGWLAADVVEHFDDHAIHG